MNELTIVGRSSSHFTRVARIFAQELNVNCTFRPILDIQSLDTEGYAGNPALKLPILVDAAGPLFGTENICRALAARGRVRGQVVLRGDSQSRMVANAEELCSQAMSTEVVLVLGKLSGGPLQPKWMPSLENSLRFLNTHLDEVLDALPVERHLSFFEVSLFCLCRHLSFRDVVDVTPWTRLAQFCDRFGERPSATSTEYRFDVA